jgi:pyrroline-5-carboxylate reductase
MNKILLIGCGHMGKALLKAWILNTNYSFLVVDPLQYKKINRIFVNRLRAFISADSIKDYKLIHLVIFAVRPQVILPVMKNINKYNFQNKTIFLSIVAGKKINFFIKYLSKKNQFIRIMPNMPAMINQGMSCLFANENVTKKNKTFVNSLFLNVGKTLWLKNELEINKVTAISGSGPGYIFFIIDAFEKAALNLGLGERATKELVHQTFLGSIKLLLKEKQNAFILANNIAVKGGTTEAGLNKFKDKKVLHRTFKKVIKAAYSRANQLGK